MVDNSFRQFTSIRVIGRNRHSIVTIFRSRSKMDSTTHREENPTTSSVITPVVVAPDEHQGNINPASLVQTIFNDPEA